MTPVERRTFVSVAPATTKSKLGPICFQNIFLLYILLVKMQKTGQKTDKNPEKNCFFFLSSPSSHPAGQPDMSQLISGETQPDGRKG